MVYILVGVHSMRLKQLIYCIDKLVDLTNIWPYRLYITNYCFYKSKQNIVLITSVTRIDCSCNYSSSIFCIYGRLYTSQIMFMNRKEHNINIIQTTIILTINLPHLRLRIEVYISIDSIRSGQEFFIKYKNTYNFRYIVMLQ